MKTPKAKKKGTPEIDFEGLTLHEVQTQKRKLKAVYTKKMLWRDNVQGASRN